MLVKTRPRNMPQARFTRECDAEGRCQTCPAMGAMPCKIAHRAVLGYFSPDAI
jgi:hypothetical protein